MRTLAIALGAVVSACTPLDETTLRGQIEGTLRGSAGAATEFCGYPVQGASAYFVHPGERSPRSGVHLAGSVSALRTHGEGDTTAEIEAVPIASPGIPAGEICRGTVAVHFETMQERMRGIVTHHYVPPLEVIARSTPVPAGVPPESRLTERAPHDIVVPIALPAGNGADVYGTLLQRHDVRNFAFAFTDGVARINPSCEGRYGPGLVLYANGRRVAVLSTYDNGEGHVDERNGIEIVANPSVGSGFDLATPGEYVVQLLGGCRDFRLHLSQHAQPAVQSHTPGG